MKTSFPKNKIRVFLVEGIHPRAEAMFREEGFAVDAHDKSLSGPALERALAGAHVLGIRSKTEVDAPALGRAARLLALGCFCIGTNQVDAHAAASRGIPVFNSPFSNTRSVAELTIAEVIALFRDLAGKNERLHRGEWDKSAGGAHEVRGRTLGIVGYGRIGSQVSVLAEAMGMRVLFFDIARRLALGNARPVRTLDELLGQSDAVTLHVPATERTERMIGRAQLRKMKKGAYLINNARGTVVDVPALAESIREKRLAGAAIDVFPVEPAGKGERFESELRALPGVILTPHIGGSTEEAQEAIAADAAEKLIRFINAGVTSGAVNVPEVDLPAQDAEADHAAPGAPRRHRILHFHRNVPGVLSKMHAVIAQLGVNIAGEYLQTRGDVGYVVLDVSPGKTDRIVRSLSDLPETIRVRELW
ncbi:MAG: phosphoglycerate dehydrogenase [Phycisphaerae bacterium]|nr:phosphoglycerate dehydrogenase [Phycisphaerae bacterium]